MTRLLAELMLCLVPASDAPATANQGASRQIAESIARTVPKGAPGSEWVGQWVLPRKVGVQVFNEAREKEMGEWGMTAGEVLKEDGDWLEVRHSQGRGPYQLWVRKRDVVKVTDAPAFFTGELGKDNDNPWLYQLRAEAWSLAGDHDKAVKDMTEAIRLEPGSEQLYIGRGTVYLRKSDLDKAVADYTEAIRLNPKSFAAFNGRGLAYEGKGEKEKAIKDYTENIRIHPQSTAFTTRGIAYSKFGEDDKALSDYTEAIKLDPKNSTAFTFRGRTYYATGQYDKAIADYTEVIRLGADTHSAQSELAWLLAVCPEGKYRDGKKAIELAQKAVDAGGKKPHWFCHIALAAAYAEVGDFEKAVEYQKRALEDEGYAKQPGGEGLLKLYERKQPYRARPVQMPPPSE